MENVNKPVVILDPHWRRMDELFSSRVFNELQSACVVVWGRDEPIPATLFNEHIGEAQVLISARPLVDASVLDAAPNLRCIIEVSGSFPDTIDYHACDLRGIEVLSCAPGFQQSVAEMALAMALSGARGLVSEHERFRHGKERWLSDNQHTDFSLFNCTIGFIGYGAIARKTHELLTAFSPTVLAYDPWLPDEVATQNSISLVGLHDLMKVCRLVFVTASPSATNHHMVNAQLLSLLPEHALIVVISRAHLVDFEALLAETESGRIRAAIDVFPEEPVDLAHRLRHNPQLILSPHRAAAIRGGRQLIGDMILHDVNAFINGDRHRQLQSADMTTIKDLAGIGDADSVTAMAVSREPSQS